MGIQEGTAGRWEIVAWFCMITLFTGNPQFMVEEGEQCLAIGEGPGNMEAGGRF